MNQGKLEVVKQEMASMKINILGISELKWMGMGKFNSDDNYIYKSGSEIFEWVQFYSMGQPVSSGQGRTFF